MQKNKKTLDSLNPHRIRLDVGGTHYTTTLKTLTNVPYTTLERMFTGRIPIDICQDDERVFIDRDGSHFHHILAFLRDPENYKVKVKDRATREEVRIEAEYYGLEQHMFKKEENPVPDFLGWLDNKTIKIPTYSSQYSGFPCTNVLDPVQTYWLSSNGLTTDQWMVFEFPTKVYINKIMMQVSNFECTCKDWDVQVSDDDEQKNWTVVKKFQTLCGNNNTGEQFFDGFEVWTKYLKLFYYNHWGLGGGSYILVTNLKFFGAAIDD